MVREIYNKFVLVKYYFLVSIINLCSLLSYFNNTPIMIVYHPASIQNGKFYLFHSWDWNNKEGDAS